MLWEIVVVDIDGAKLGVTRCFSAAGADLAWDCALLRVANGEAAAAYKRHDGVLVDQVVRRQAAGGGEWMLPEVGCG